jgi:integrase
MKHKTVTVFIRKGKHRLGSPSIRWMERRNGKVVRKVESFPTLEAAKNAACLKELTLNSGAPLPTTERISWDNMVTLYMATKKRKAIASSTESNIKGTLERFGEITDYPSNKEFGQACIETYIDSRISAKRSTWYKDKPTGEYKRRDLDDTISLETVNREIRNLKGFISFLRKRYYITVDLELEECKTNGTSEPRSMTVDEVRTLLNKCKEFVPTPPDHHGFPVKQNDDLYCGIIIALYTGLRQKDIWYLCADQIDVENNCLRRVRSFKSRCIIECIPIAPEAMQIIVNYMVNHGVTGNAKLFEGKFPRRRWNKIRPGWSDFNFHSTRKTHGSVLAAGGATISEIQKRLHHSDPRITEKYYIKTEDNTSDKMPSADWGLTA